MARGTAISLVALCFMGGGGAGTAIGERIITPFGYANFYAVYGLFLLGLVVAAMMVVRETQA
jgi:hypothetical protein